MPSHPRVTVIVTTRNRPQLLRQSLESVQAQDCQDYECIVVDDASEDFGATERIVHGLRDARFRVIQSRVARTITAEALSRFAKGLALNTAIKHAAADWLTFLDDDDIYAPYRLSRGLMAVESSRDIRMTVAHASEFNTVAPTWPELTPMQLRAIRNPLAEMMPHSSTWTLSRTAALDAGLFRPYGVLEDWELYARLSSRVTIWTDNTITASIRRHEGVRRNYGLDARIAMRRQFLRSGELSPNWASRAFQLYRLSLLESHAGDYLNAAGHALMSLVPVPYPRYVRQTVRALAGGMAKREDVEREAI